MVGQNEISRNLEDHRAAFDDVRLKTSHQKTRPKMNLMAGNARKSDKMGSYGNELKFSSSKTNIEEI